jgi:galactokinase
VNLIGEHTDYNDGYVFPMGIDRGMVVAFRARADRRVRAHAAAFGETGDVELDRLSPGRVLGWMGYVAGVGWALERAGHKLVGLDLVIDGDLPIGGGLSSSAALEVAVARAWCAAAGVSWDPGATATLCQKAENTFVGVPCGLMDQLAAARSQAGCAMLLDCRSLEAEFVTVPEGAVVVVMDSGIRRELSTSAYPDRRAACEAAVAALRSADPGVRALRDVTAQALASARSRLDPVTFRRASHVVAENGRPPAMAQALRTHDLAAAGRLMNDSHASLRDLYEVSGPELDRLTELARSHPACFGARMTGAGFGGCAIALVDRAGAEGFATAMGGFLGQGGVFVTKAEGGARLISD